MSVLCIGDLHFKATNAVQSDEATTELIRIAKSTSNLKLIVLMGDVMNDHSSVKVGASNRAYLFIKELSTISPVVVLVGNHDYINNSQFLTRNHSLLPFGEIPGVTVVDRPLAKRVHGKKLVFVPYTQPGRLKEALNLLVGKTGKKVEWKDAFCIFGHQEIFGCMMYGGRGSRSDPLHEEKTRSVFSGEGGTTSTEGDVWKKSDPLLVSGHMHTAHWVDDNVYFTGSSIPVSFGEEDEKSVAVLDLNTKEMTTVKLNIIIRRTYRITTEQFKTWRPKKNVIAKLVVRGSSGEIALVKSSARYKKLTDMKVVIVTEVQNEVDESELNIQGLKSFDALLLELIGDDTEVKGMLEECR